MAHRMENNKGNEFFVSWRQNPEKIASSDVAGMGSSPRKFVSPLFPPQEKYWGRDSNECVTLICFIATIATKCVYIRLWRIQDLKMYYNFNCVIFQGSFIVGMR
jgi:hypothetical protein